jgi:uncharacterized iron-regulated membrane protein
VKKFLAMLHLFVGLTSSFFLICMSLSGAVIAFEAPLNRLVHPELTKVVPTGPALSWDEVKARVEQEEPGWKLVRFYFPDRADWSTYVRLRSKATHKIRHVYVDQYTGAVLGSTEDGSNWILKVHDLHVNFLSGKAGNQIVTWSTVALLLLSLSGIVLWWPRKVFGVASTAPAARLNRELHYTVGFWSFLAMVAFAVTGLGLHYQTGKLLNLLNTASATRNLPGHGTTIDGMLEAAREALPGADIPRLLLPEKAGDPVFIYQRYPEDKTPAGRSFTTLDPKTGRVLSVGSSRSAPFLQTALVQWTREVHTGTLLGVPGEILVSLFASMLVVLAMTGPMIWWNKWRASARGRKALLDRSKKQVAVAR